MKNKNIVMIYTDKFPDGGAGANRHLTIGKGLVELGNKYTVFIIRPTEDKNNIYNKDITASIDGINYEYTAGTTVWKPRKKIIQFFLFLKGFIISFVRLHQIEKLYKIDILISAFSSISMNFCYFIYCKIKGIKFVYHIDEYPWMIIRPSNYNKYYSALFLKYFYKLFDALIIMTMPLMEYYKNLVSKNAKLFQLPMTVDSDRFYNIKINTKNTIDILYCGSMNNDKDGVNILTESFCKLSLQYDNLRLLLVGNLTDTKSVNEIKEIIHNYKMENKIIFTGELSRDLIPELLCNANILALPRPNNIQTEGGFPTKLGEYLMAEKPVVVTKVGEIPNYLKDRETAFLAEPGDIISFKNKLEEVILNKELANTVATNGKKLAMKTFDFKIQMKRLTDFFNFELL